jgi:hypothetical protein
VSNGTVVSLNINNQTGTANTIGATFNSPAISYAAATGSTYSQVGLSAYTITLTGSTGVTALAGLSLLVGSPTVTDASALTVTTASAATINGPLPAGSVTFTNSFALDVPTFATNGTTAAGIRCAAPTGASAKYALLASSGNVGMVGTVSLYNNVATAGAGVPAIYGIDNRTGLTSADGAPITLYTSTASNQIYRVSADIFATAAVTGTANYTITWTENSTTQTMVVTATAINVLGTQSNLIRPDNGTNITSQLTGTFTGTFTVVGLVERIA